MEPKIGTEETEERSEVFKKAIIEIYIESLIEKRKNRTI
jgi:hypothetical protein